MKDQDRRDAANKRPPKPASAETMAKIKAASIELSDEHLAGASGGTSATLTQRKAGKGQQEYC